MGKDDDLTKDPVTRTRSVSSDDDLPSYAPPSYQLSSSSKVSSSPVPSLIPGPSKILTVLARGTRVCRLPTPSKELEISIFEGTATFGEPLYVSTRASRRSGNAVLRHSQRGDLLATNYKFGPFRDPVVRHVNMSSDVKHSCNDNEEGELAISTKTHPLSHKLDITLAGSGKTFNWQYVKTQLRVGKTRVLALEADNTESSTEKSPPKTLAVLLRTDETRTEGTSKWDAGNGGQLVIDANASEFMDESFIVATCLLMLKREIDRQRGRQAAVIAGAGAGA